MREDFPASGAAKSGLCPSARDGFSGYESHIVFARVLTGKPKTFILFFQYTKLVQRKVSLVSTVAATARRICATAASMSPASSLSEVISGVPCVFTQICKALSATIYNGRRFLEVSPVKICLNLDCVSWPPASSVQPHPGVPRYRD
jgi:hypothetical protein